jgi:hypothetical protein
LPKNALAVTSAPGSGSKAVIMSYLEILSGYKKAEQTGSAPEFSCLAEIFRQEGPVEVAEGIVDFLREGFRASYAIYPKGKKPKILPDLGAEMIPRENSCDFAVFVNYAGPPETSESVIKAVKPGGRIYSIGNSVPFPAECTGAAISDWACFGDDLRFAYAVRKGVN